MQKKQPARLSNSDCFCSRVMDAEMAWRRMLAKYVKLKLPSHLAHFALHCTKKKARVKFHPEILKLFISLSEENEGIKKTINDFQPHFEIENGILVICDEPTLSVCSLLLKKACEKIIRDSEHAPILNRSKLKSKVLARLARAKGFKAKVNVENGKNGAEFCLKLTLTFSKKCEGKGVHIVSQEMNILGSKTSILNEVDALVKIYSE